MLEEYVDFDVASKLPPKVTQEMTNSIEEMIKQRILDEMFDDPVRLATLNTEETAENLDFTKSSRGLAGIYDDEYVKKLNKLNPEVFNSNDENAALKKDIESLFANVMQSLNTLSHIHYAPKAAREKTEIRSQNVPAIELEEAVPFNVSR